MIFKNFLQQPSKGMLAGALRPEQTNLLRHFQAIAFNAGINRKHWALL